MNLSAVLRLSHGLIDTAWEVDHLERIVVGGLVVRQRAVDDELRQVTLLGLAVLLRHSGGPERQAHLVHGAADGGHERWAKGYVGCVGHIEHHAQTALYASHVVSGKLANLVTSRILVHVHLADNVGKLAGINLHWARCRAESIGSTGLIAIVLILLLERSQALGVRASYGEVANLALNGYTHAT